MNNDNLEIGPLVGPELNGIVWFSERPLKSIPKNYSTFDYLFDGILTQFVNLEPPPAQGHSLFFSQNFGRPLFLAHISLEETPSPQKSFEKVLGLMTKMERDQKVLILSEKEEIKLPLKQFQNIEFEILVLKQT